MAVSHLYLTDNNICMYLDTCVILPNYINGRQPVSTQYHYMTKLRVRGILNYTSILKIQTALRKQSELTPEIYEK
jgi:hypothetical protein